MTDLDTVVVAVRDRARNVTTRTDQRPENVQGLRPVMPATLARAESALGWSLPSLLRRLYCEVGNGGFGPGYGLRPLVTRRGDDTQSVVQSYQAFRDTSWREGDSHFASVPEWPDGVLPLFDWGDAVWSCVDAKTTEGIIVTHDDDVGATVTDFTIASWMAAWAGGVNLWREIYEEGDATPFGDPFTGKTLMVKGAGRAKGRPYR